MTPPAASAARSRPNIVLITTDQQRWDALGVTSAGRVHSPHLDRLAATGCRFDTALVPTPLCTPSRISLLKSSYATQHGVRANEFGPLPDPEDTLPALLKGCGYRTALVGKDHAFDAGAHFGQDLTWRQAELSGRDGIFDYVRIFDHFGRNPGPGEGETASDAAVRDLRRRHMGSKFLESEPFAPEEETTSRMTDLAIEFIDANAAGDDPFFMWLSFPDPHPPFMVCEPYASMYRGRDVGTPATRPDEYEGAAPRVGMAAKLMRMDEYTDADIRRIRELYFGMVTFVDDQIGRLRTHLDRRGVGDTTYLVFTSDHGEYLGDHGMVRKSVAMYDCLVRVPLIVNGPGVRPAVTSEFLASTLDITPTLLDVAGVENPYPREGVSLLDHLRGGPPPDRRHVFGTYGVAGHAITPEEVAELDYDHLLAHPYVWGSWVSPLAMHGRVLMVRGARFKLLLHEGGFRELYDLDQDPDELHNVCGSPATGQAELELLAAAGQWLLTRLPDVPPFEAIWP